MLPFPSSTAAAAAAAVGGGGELPPFVLDLLHGDWEDNQVVLHSDGHSRRQQLHRDVRGVVCEEVREGEKGSLWT